MNRLFYIFVCMFFVCIFTQAQTSTRDSHDKQFRNRIAIPLKNGDNAADINGDGKDDCIFVARRENYNAHGYSQYSFYIHYKDTDAEQPLWYLVTFEDKDHSRYDNLTTVEGADGNIQDIRVLRSDSPSDSSLTVIIGRREMGQSYADSGKVSFTVYQLCRNQEGVPGWPPFYFQESRTIFGKMKHVDINEAFSSELGISGDSTNVSNEK